MKTLTFIPNSIGLTIGLLMAVAALSVDAADYESEEFQKAHNQYLEVSNDEGGSAKKTAKAWGQIYLEDEQDPLALVFLGASHTLMGRDALMPWSKMNHTEQGLEEMVLAQRLIKAEHKQIFFNGMSVDLHVKTTAAIIFTQVPEFFGRQEEGLVIFEDILSDPAFIAMPAEAKTYVYFFGISAAKLLEEETQAVEWTATLSELDIDDDYKQAALNLE